MVPPEQQDLAEVAVADVHGHDHDDQEVEELQMPAGGGPGMRGGELQLPAGEVHGRGWPIS